MLCKKFDCEYNENDECKCDWVSIGGNGECETYVNSIADYLNSRDSLLGIEPFTFRMKEDE